LHRVIPFLRIFVTPTTGGTAGLIRLYRRPTGTALERVRISRDLLRGRFGSAFQSELSGRIKIGFGHLHPHPSERRRAPGMKLGAVFILKKGRDTCIAQAKPEQMGFFGLPIRGNSFHRKRHAQSICKPVACHWENGTNVRRLGLDALPGCGEGCPSGLASTRRAFSPDSAMSCGVVPHETPVMRMERAATGPSYWNRPRNFTTSRQRPVRGRFVDVLSLRPAIPGSISIVSVRRAPSTQTLCGV
jgi:hypothetical protein